MTEIRMSAHRSVPRPPWGTGGTRGGCKVNTIETIPSRFLLIKSSAAAHSPGATSAVAHNPA